jgi:hypothetical protein
MKKLSVLAFCFGCFAAVSTSSAIDLKSSKVTQVVNDVQIISAADQTKKDAVVNDVFSMPDILRTGPASRAELVASDETITRVGANTIFSFDPESRTIDLKQGSLLFHSAHGKGGGTIHTGSATASVLGTTLIVTTTPSGGLKVLDLEGEVEVKFLNGLKQKLESGEMTFILAGGNQLAPIIVFRLDDLVQNSLLVKGFHQPLSSLPLILHQINKQIKLIKSGRATDTGLVAGNDANANQVEVLDANTIESVDNSVLKAALNADATINQPSLKDKTIPVPPNHIFLTSSFKIPDNDFFSSRTFKGFAAGNIFFNTPDAGLNPLTVNMSPYAKKSEFDFVAVNDLDIEGSTTFGGLSSLNTLFLVAGNQILFSPNITVQANVSDFELSALGEMTLNEVSLLNNTGNIGLTSGSEISLQDGTSIHAAGSLSINGVVPDETSGGDSSGDINFNGSSFKNFASAAAINPADISLSGDNGVNINGAEIDSYGGSVNITSANGLVDLEQSPIFAGNLININGSSVTLNNSSLTANGIVDKSISTQDSVAITGANGVNVNNSTITTDTSGGSVSMNSSSGSVTVTGTSIQTRYLTLNSGDGILLDASGQSLIASGAGSIANLTAKNTIMVNNANFSSFAIFNVVANTVTIVNSILSPITNVGTLTGNVNVNGPAEYGEFNLINSSWEGTPITSASQVTLSSGPGRTPGIYSYPHP